MTKITMKIFIVQFFLFHLCLSQESLKNIIVVDSLKNKNYVELKEKFIKCFTDTTKSTLYLNAYLKKAVSNKDSIKMARGYTLLSYYQNSENIKLSYLDKAILLSNKLNNENYPVVSYIYKGKFYEGKWDYDNALQAYLKALQYAKKNNSKRYTNYSKYHIAIIKNKVGKYQEALKIFRKSIAFEEQKKVLDSMNYLEVLYSTSEAYSNVKLIDSSDYYINKALTAATNNVYGIKSRLLLIKAINLFKKRQFDKASHTLNKIKFELHDLDDKTEWIRAHFYLGKIKEFTQQQDSAKYYYKKIDTFFQSSTYALHEVRDSYVSLLRIAKEKKNKDEQLFYIKRLLDFDSTIHINNHKLSEKLITEYDTQQLLLEKQEIIQTAHQGKKLYRSLFTIFAVLFVIMSVVILFQYLKRKKYQKRFEELIKKISKKADQTTTSEIIFSPIEEIGMAQNLIIEISEKLRQFEAAKDFLKPNITTTVLAKKFKTNNKYISKVIHTTKGKKVTHYINDLRIDYTVERLKKDKIFRAYTIKAIATEIGFSSPESFSKHFYKKTGLYPSYFIKKLNTR